MAAKRTHYDFSCFPDQKKRKISLGSSSSSSTTHRWSHEVFLSFRGKDTRKTFTDHLYTALVGAGIDTFRDDELLPRGQDFSSELLKSIQESRISIIVFSRNYASSRWCLDELVKIIECKKTTGQLVFPIFYNVDPSQVRNQTGCFAEAFERHQKRFVNETEKVESWRAALTEASNLSGYDLQNGHEAKFIKKIVEDILREVNHTFLNVAAHPVGIDSRAERVNFLLSIRSDDVRMIGIYGLGGIGKTTIAKEVYNRIFRQFEGSCFLANIREVAELDGLVELQKTLLFELLKEKNLEIGCVDRGMTLIKKRLHSKRVLIVLDDLDHLSQLNSLAGNRDWFGPRSKIIITTRNMDVLRGLKADERYMAEVLNHTESLQLFSWHAFRGTNPSKNYVELANDIVRYAGGLPLAFEVLGSSLFERDMLEWESAFEKLQQILPSEIKKILRISFDALDDKMKNIFLDIACFFIGMDKDYAITILDGCGFFSRIGISDLIRKCLLRIDGNMLMMHGLLRDMGREIVREESPNDLGKRSRLWFHEDVCNVLEENEENKGSKKVEGIKLTLPMSKKIQWCTKSFAGMHKLRLLQINRVHLSGNFEHLPKKLRWLRWHGCPLKYLPFNFHLEKLVVLDMQFSKIKTLWQDGKYLKSLKILNLSNSKSLTKILNFNAVPMLEKLVLESCTSLMEIDESIGLLDRLVHLNVKDCMNLECLPGSICKLKSTKYLDISGCTKLEELPEHLGHMEGLTELFVDGTSIKQLPFSIGQLENLRTLSLGGFNRRLPTKSSLPHISSWVSRRKNSDSIRFLPSSISSLRSLTKLVLKDCNLFEGDFRVDLGNLSSLKYLNLSYNNFRSLPYSVSHLSMLETLYLQDCKSLQSISNLPPNLQDLKADGCTSLKKISNLPPNLQNLDASICTSLEKISDLPPNLRNLLIFSCVSLEKISKAPNMNALSLINYDYYFPSNHIKCPMETLNAPSLINYPFPHPYIRKRPVKELQCFQGPPIIREHIGKFMRLPHQDPRYYGGITDYFYHGSELPDDLSLKITGSSICTEVPVLVNSIDNAYWIELGAVFTVEHECPMKFSAAPYAIIKTNNGVEWTYKPSTLRRCIPGSRGDYVWQCFICPHFVERSIKGGEQLEVSFIPQSPIIHVKKCGIRIF